MTLGAADTTRYCPNCGKDTGAEHCPADGTPTFLRALRVGVNQTLTTGDIVGGRYRIKGILGQGGFGAVFAAEHLMTGQAAAVKVMVSDGAGLEQDLVQRFLLEARITASLSHPNTVRIYDFGQTDTGILFMAMEHLRGPTLDGHLKAAVARGTALSELEAAIIGVHVLRSLTEAHAAGLVHRDLKPANLILVQMIGEPQLVKVLDFGIARIHGSALTQAGTALGTPTYMSPEQARGEVPDGRSDLYSLGCILFACVAGQPPFAGDNAMSVLLAHQLTPLPDLREFARVPLSDDFIAVVERATAKQAGDRYANAIAMREALEAVVALPRAARSDPVWGPTLEADVVGPAVARPGQFDSESGPTLEADVVGPAPRMPRPPSISQPVPRPAVASPAERTPVSTRLRRAAAPATPRPAIPAYDPVAAAQGEDTQTRHGFAALSVTAVATAQDDTPLPDAAASVRPASGAARGPVVAAAVVAAAAVAAALWWFGQDPAAPGAPAAVVPVQASAPVAVPAAPAVAQPAAQPVEPAVAQPPPVAAVVAPVAEPAVEPPGKPEPATVEVAPQPAPPVAEARPEAAPEVGAKARLAPKRAIREPQPAREPRKAAPADRNKAFDLL